MKISKFADFEKNFKKIQHSANMVKGMLNARKLIDTTKWTNKNRDKRYFDKWKYFDDATNDQLILHMCKIKLRIHVNQAFINAKQMYFKAVVNNDKLFKVVDKYFDNSVVVPKHHYPQVLQSTYMNLIENEGFMTDQLEKIT